MINQTAERAAGTQPHHAATRLARIAGALYLPVFVLGPFALLFVRGKLIVPGDAAATADRIADQGWLLRTGSVVELYLALTDIALAALFYVLLRPVSKPLALVSTLLRLTWAVVAAITILTNIAALKMLSGTRDLAAFNADQLQAGALFVLNLHRDAFAIGFVAFGTHLLILGYLIWKSNVIPRPVGIMLAVAGVGYVTNSLLILAWATPIQPLLLLPALPAELTLCLWLLVKGVR